MLLLGTICLVLLLLALLIAFIICKFSSRARKATIIAGNKQGQLGVSWWQKWKSFLKIDIQYIALKAIFSTDYVWQSKDRSETIQKLDDLTDQVSHLNG